MIKRILYLIISLLIASILYLSYFGISTNKFNSKIENKIKKINPKINIELQNVKILVDIFNLSINLETKNPVISVNKEDIKLKIISTDYNIKSLFNKEFAIRNLFLEFEKNKINKLIKLVRANKDSPQLFILDKIIKNGEISRLSGKFIFNENGELNKDEFEISAKIENLSLSLFNKKEINNLSSVVKYTNNQINLKDVVFNYIGLKFLSNKIIIDKQNQDFLVKGNLKNIENTIPQEILSILFKNNTFKEVVLSSNNDFSFNVSEKLAISELEINSKISLKKANSKYFNENIKKYLPNFDDNLRLIDHNININYNNNIKIDGLGEFQIGEEKNKVKYNFDFIGKKVNYSLNIDLKETPIKIDIINFIKKKSVKAQLKVEGEKKNKKNLIKKISFNTNKSNITLDNLELSNKYKILNIDKIRLNYFDNLDIKNDLLISNLKKDYYSISGRNFDLSKIIDEVLINNNESSIKLFDKKNRTFEINLNKSKIDENYHLLDLKGSFQMKDNKVHDMSLSSSLTDKKNISLTIKSKDKKKITTFYSDLAQPFVQKYKFIKGFEKGTLDFYSVEENQISNSQLKISNFKLKELPVLTKLLSLASLQGIADVMTGEGIRFNEFEMKFNNNNKLMTVDEIYAIGPAISIMMSGYIEKDKLISLRGTLVPATTLNKTIGSIPFLGDILVGKKTGEGVFGVSFKIKGPPSKLETSVNPIKTLTPRFITRTLEKIKKN